MNLEYMKFYDRLSKTYIDNFLLKEKYIFDLESNVDLFTLLNRSIRNTDIHLRYCINNGYYFLAMRKDIEISNDMLERYDSTLLILFCIYNAQKYLFQKYHKIIYDTIFSINQITIDIYNKNSNGILCKVYLVGSYG